MPAAGGAGGAGGAGAGGADPGGTAGEDSDLDEVAFMYVERFWPWGFQERPVR